MNQMDPNRVNTYRPTLLRKFKNCVTCYDVSTDSDIEDKEGDAQVVSTDSESDDDEDVQNVSEKDEVECLSQLHLAAKRGDTEVVRSLLISSANVDVLDTKQNTPLHYAILKGHADVVSLLLSKNASVNATNASGQTSFHLASKNGDLAIAQLLLSSNGDVNAVCKRQATPLHLAAKRGHAEIVKNLILNGANVNACNKDKKMTALHLACQNGHTSIVEILLDNNAAVDVLNQSDETPFYLAAKNGHADVSDLLLSRGVCDFVLTTDIETPLHAPLRLKSIAIFNAVCRRKTTRLHIAAERGHADIVQILISNGANVNACNNVKKTALHLACENGHTSIVEMLLDNHAIVDVTKQSDETPFYLAAKNGHADVSDLLLCRGVCDFVLKDNKQTPLHVAVQKGHTKVVEVILRHSSRLSRISIDCGQKLQENAKHFTETNGIHPIQLLISDGRRVSAGIVWTEKSKPLEIWEDSYDRTALVIAAKSAQPKMVQLLLNADQCTYSDEHLRSSIYWLKTSSFNYDATDCRHNKEIGKVRSYDEQYNTYCDDRKEIAQALINVIHQGTSLHGVMTYWFGSEPEETILINHLIQILLEKGADFNIKNSYGKTPLMIASENGCCDTIQILFDWEHRSGMKLDVDARDQHGATALMKAAEMHHVSVMRLLLNHKVSANIHDYFGFTALHAVVYKPNTTWFDFYFFCKGLLEKHFDGINSLEMSSRDKPSLRKETAYPLTVIGRVQNYLRRARITIQRKLGVAKLRLDGETVELRTLIDRLQSNLEHTEVTSQLREEAVNLLLDNDETNVNAIDVRGNTPLDLAVKSSKRINSAILKALKNRGVIHNSEDPEDEAPIEVAGVDDRGRNPLHRLIISGISDRLFEYRMESTEREQDEEQFDFMVNGIRLSPGNFRKSATATDHKGRTPLHYAPMSPSCNLDRYRDPTRLLLELGSEVNAVDMYGKTPLHYAEEYGQYELLVQNGADENTKDNFGNTPRDLMQLRHLMTINEDDAREFRNGNRNNLYASIDIAKVLNHVRELTRCKIMETIRIYSQSPRPQESAEEAIWKIWTENDLIRLNRRLSQLNPLIQHFMDRLADGIKNKDWRFECQPSLVGSADEEAKAVLAADFDFNFKLIKFSQLCDPFPHPQAPNGYFKLRRKPNEDTKSYSDEKFDSFFNLDKCLLTYEVNSRFKIILEEVLSDPTLWQDEHLFDWNMKHEYSSRYGNLEGLGKTIELRMIHPKEDGEGGFLFITISIDIVACVHVKDWWPEDSLPVGIKPSVKTDGCAFVFRRCSSDHFVFSETLSRISFSPLESQIIKESSPLIKAAYIICKMILNSYSKATNQLKTCVFFCMEALNARNGSETEKEENITPKQLAFWVERIMFCYMEFSRHGVYPTYFMPSFRRRVLHDMGPFHRCLKLKDDKCDYFSKDLEDFGYYTAFGIYLDLCPDGSTFDIPIETRPDDNGRSDPMWKKFDREEFIKTLSSRSSH